MAKKRMKKNIIEALNSEGFDLYKRLEHEVADNCKENLVMLCHSWQTFLTANEQLRTDGLTIVSQNGYVRKHPAFEIATKALESYNKIANNLNLNRDEVEKPAVYNEFQTWKK